MAAVCVLLSACGPTARKRVDGDLVQTVVFRGNGAVKQVQLRNQMAQGRSGAFVRVPLLNRVWKAVPLDRAQLDDDAYRLEVWLAHYGYFDAHFAGWRVRQLRKRKFRSDGSLKKAGVVKIVGYLDVEGASYVDKVSVKFIDDARALSIIGRTVKRRSYLQPRSQFLLDNVDYLRDDLIRSLHDKGRAYASVHVKVDSYPRDHKVDVYLTATAGPLARFGEITIHGNTDVREQDIRDVLGLSTGRQYSASKLSSAQQALISMGVFSVARVLPDLSDPTVVDVPIRVEVTEGKMHTIRTGVGGSWDGSNLMPTASVSYKDAMPGKRPGLFEAEVHASVQTSFKPLSLEPLGGGSVGRTWPRYFSNKSDLRALLSVDKASLTDGQGFPYFKGEASVGTSTRIDTFGLDKFKDRVVLGVAAKLEAYKWGGNLLSPNSMPADEQAQQDLLIQALTGDGAALRNPFVLPILEATLTMDWRTDRQDREVVLDPFKGYYYSMGVRQAVPWSNDSFRFTNVWGESRLYWSPRFKRGNWLTLAARGRAQWLPTLRKGEVLEERVPYSERAFMGGSQDMRGFRQGHVGAYNCFCDPELTVVRNRKYWIFSPVTGPTEKLVPNVSFAPKGGSFVGLMGGEVRMRMGSGRTLALFSDVGIMAPSVDETFAKMLRFDGGIGYRQGTPVGPIRFDLAVRPGYSEDVGPVGLYAGERAAGGLYFGCDDFELDKLDRRIPGLGISRSRSLTKPPLVINFSIGIGEAL
ncbi:MAG: outer membrane translocation and assembly module TamA [Kiritimatiellia bacterium]|jgi:outer membrane translocation and assembly module TamA